MAIAGALACGSGADATVPVSPDPKSAPVLPNPRPHADADAAPGPAEPSPSEVEPTPDLDPVPSVTTDIDPAVFHWSHGTDELALIEVIVRLDESPEAEVWRALSRAREGKTTAARDIGMRPRFARGDRWLVFGADEPVFRGKAKGFWPEQYGEDMVSLRIALGHGPEGLAVRARDWKGRPEVQARRGRSLESDDPQIGEVVEVLQRSIGMVAGQDVVELLERRPLTVNDVDAIAGRFCGGTYLVVLRAKSSPSSRESVVGVVVLGLDGRVTTVLPVERTTQSGHYVGDIIDLDGDGYEEAVVERSEESGAYQTLLYWREGQPQLEELVLEDA